MTRAEERELYAVADALPVDSGQRRELLLEARRLSDARHATRHPNCPHGDRPLYANGMCEVCYEHYLDPV